MGKTAFTLPTSIAPLFRTLVVYQRSLLTERRRLLLKLLWCGFALLFLTAAPLLAQSERATLRGTVTDSSGAVVPGAEVVVTEVATNIEVRHFATDDNGNYEIPDLKPGFYRLQVALPGFRTFVADRTLLDAGQTRRIDVVLQIGETSQTINVVAGVSVITTETGTIGGEIESKKFADQPAVDVYPSPLALLTTVPGIQGNGWNLVISGVGRNQQTWAMDGIANDTAGDQNDNPNFYEGVQVTTVIGGADSSRLTNFNMVSKRGANEFHGGVFYRHFNSGLNARQFFEQRKTPFIQHEWDAEAGGPIFKNKTFFYASWFHQIIPLGSFQLRSVPTLKMRQGDFSQISRPIFDPITGERFPSNIVPANRVSQVSQKVQDLYYPKPNVGDENTLTNNFGWVFPYNSDLYKGDWPFIRIDHNLTKNNSLFFRWAQRKTPYIRPGGTPDLTWTQARDHRQTVASDTYVFSPHLVNTFTFGWQTDFLLIGEQEKGFTPLFGDDVVKAIGLQGVNRSGYHTQGFPTIAVSGLSTLSSNNGGLDNINVDNWARTWEDSVTWSLGKHVLKFGTELRQYKNRNPTISADVYGNLNFNGSSTANGANTGIGYADFLLGFPFSATRLDPLVNRKSTDRQFGLYATDSFKVTQKLTLDYGLRWDYYGRPEFLDGLMYNWDSATGNVIVASDAMSKIHPLYPTNRIKVVSGDVVPKADMKNFRPRIAAAYRLTDKTVLRGGYGEYTESLGAFARLLGGGPFQLSETYQNNKVSGVLQSPVLALPNPFPASAATAVIPSQSIQGYPMQTDNGTYRQYNFSVERQFHDIGLRVSYIGTRGSGLNYNLNVNKPPASTTPFTPSRRPYTQFVNTTVTRDDGLWHYDSFQVEGHRRVGSFTFNAHWTWSNNMINYGILEDPYNVTNRWSRDTVDRRQYVVAYTTWEVPVGRGRRFLADAGGIVNQVLGGWNLQSISYFASGRYYSPSFSGSDPSNTGTTGGLPDRVSDGNLSGDKRNYDVWYDPTAFKVPAAGHFGNSGVNILVGQPLNAHHVSIAKVFPLTERFKMTFTSEISDLFNHPHFDSLQTNISNPNPGKFTSTIPYYNPEKQGFRQIAMKLRVEF
ncbi:MAG TPA: TonB-dependent receptor [Acidobacteriota bacterium]